MSCTSLWFRKAIVRNAATGRKRQRGKLKLTGHSCNLLRTHMQKVSEWQWACNQLPSLLKIKLIEAVGPCPAHRLSGRAQRHVNYTSPFRTHNIFVIESTQKHWQWTLTKTHAIPVRGKNSEMIIAKCLRREGRTTANWRAGRRRAGQGGGPTACLCPLHVEMHSTRLAKLWRTDWRLSDRTSTPSETTNDSMHAQLHYTVLVLLHF